MQALQDHDTVINVIDDAVVAETEKFSEVAGMKRERERERERDGSEVTLGGKAFHARAPVTRNAR